MNERGRGSVSAHLRPTRPGSWFGAPGEADGRAPSGCGAPHAACRRSAFREAFDPDEATEKLPSPSSGARWTGRASGSRPHGWSAAGHRWPGTAPHPRHLVDRAGQYGNYEAVEVGRRVAGEEPEVETSGAATSAADYEAGPRTFSGLAAPRLFCRWHGSPFRRPPPPARRGRSDGVRPGWGNVINLRACRVPG